MRSGLGKSVGLWVALSMTKHKLKWCDRAVTHVGPSSYLIAVVSTPSPWDETACALLFSPVPAAFFSAMYSLRKLQAIVLGNQLEPGQVHEQLQASYVPVTEADCRNCADPCDEGK